MKINQVQLTTLIENKASPALWIHSPPGSGKAHAITEAASANGLVIHDVRAAHLSTLDVSPVKIDGETVWPPMVFLPRETNTPMLFLIDDMDCAVSRVHDAMVELAATRKLGDYTVPENVQVVVAASAPIATPAAKHFMIFEYAYDAEAVA